MTDDPQVWHYGLVARWWAEFNTAGPEIDFFRSFIEQFGQPALDAPCGTGRLLVPYLSAGLDVDGCDVSADMLALCAERAKREGVTPRLYRQALHELDLPRPYRTIVFCGGFGLGGTRGQDQETLNRLYRHLQPGGALVMDHYLPYMDAEEWRYWMKEERQKLPAPWPSTGKRKRAENGDELELRSRLTALDPLDQSATRQMRALLWRDGELVREEEYTLIERLYFRNEILDMLAAAGFHDVQVQTGYTGEPASADSDIIVFVAAKPLSSDAG